MAPTGDRLLLSCADSSVFSTPSRRFRPLPRSGTGWPVTKQTACRLSSNSYKDAMTLHGSCRRAINFAPLDTSSCSASAGWCTAPSLPTWRAASWHKLWRGVIHDRALPLWCHSTLVALLPLVPRKDMGRLQAWYADYEFQARARHAILYGLQAPATGSSSNPPHAEEPPSGSRLLYRSIRAKTQRWWRFRSPPLGRKHALPRRRRLQRGRPP